MMEAEKVSETVAFISTLKQAAACDFSGRFLPA
jgi:hypothetical protein